MSSNHRLALFRANTGGHAITRNCNSAAIILQILIAVLLVFPSFESVAGERKFEGGRTVFNIPAERPFDAVNIFDDLGKSLGLQSTDETKLWWERMVRGEVGKERFLILCALKDGNWKTFEDIRNYVEFQMRKNYTWSDLRKMLVRMSGKPNAWYSKHNPKKARIGEGWLEKNDDSDQGGNSSKWRIEPSVLPLLYFLLMGCPEENRCEPER